MRFRVVGREAVELRATLYEAGYIFLVPPKGHQIYTLTHMKKGTVYTLSKNRNINPLLMAMIQSQPTAGCAKWQTQDRRPPANGENAKHHLAEDCGLKVQQLTLNPKRQTLNPQTSNPKA